MCYLGNTRNHEILRNYHTKLSQHYAVNTGGTRTGDQSPVLLVLIIHVLFFSQGADDGMGRGYSGEAQRDAHPVTQGESLL